MTTNQIISSTEQMSALRDEFNKMFAVKIKPAMKHLLVDPNNHAMVQHYCWMTWREAKGFKLQ